MSIINDIKNKVITNKWIESTSKGNDAVGRTLESLLKKESENFELPDYMGIELKAKFSKRESYITLFCATPDSYLFETKRIVQKYGYPDRNFSQFNVFNISVYGNRRVRLYNNYFKLYVDWKNKKVILTVYNKEFTIIDEITSWSFEMLKEKLERKLNKLAYAHAIRKYENKKLYFKYTSIDFYKLTSFDNFLLLIDKGIIKVTFRIGIYKSGKRFGEMYDHGTCFSIDEHDINKLFDKVDLLDQGE